MFIPIIYNNTTLFNSLQTIHHKFKILYFLFHNLFVKNNYVTTIIIIYYHYTINENRKNMKSNHRSKFKHTITSKVVTRKKKEKRRSHY